MLPVLDPQSSSGGFLQPPQNKVVDFGIRVTPVEGGYLINKFSEGMAVCTTLEQARTIVSNYFEETLNAPTPPESEKNVAKNLPFSPEPGTEDPQTETQVEPQVEPPVATENLPS